MTQLNTIIGGTATLRSKLTPDPKESPAEEGLLRRSATLQFALEIFSRTSRISPQSLFPEQAMF